MLEGPKKEKKKKKVRSNFSKWFTYANIDTLGVS